MQMQQAKHLTLLSQEALPHASLPKAVLAPWWQRALGKLGAGC